MALQEKKIGIANNAGEFLSTGVDKNKVSIISKDISSARLYNADDVLGRKELEKFLHCKWGYGDTLLHGFKIVTLMLTVSYSYTILDDDMFSETNNLCGEEQIKNSGKKEIIDLAKILYESKKVFPFPGIDPGAYLKMKRQEEEFQQEHPERLAPKPIDELLKKFTEEGLRVAFGEYSESGNVFILPAGSTEIEYESILPKHLLIQDGMDENLKNLILMSMITAL